MVHFSLYSKRKLLLFPRRCLLRYEASSMMLVHCLDMRVAVRVCGCATDSSQNNTPLLVTAWMLCQTDSLVTANVYDAFESQSLGSRIQTTIIARDTLHEHS